MARSAVRNLYEMMEFPSEGVFSKVVARGEMSNHTLMCLAKGTDITEHTSSREATVTILKGKGVFVLNGKKIAMEPGVCIFMPKNAPHALRAEEDLAFLLSLSGKEPR
ncbi:MAG: cupin domain-containing protein [Chlamydiota bacterium]